MATEPDLVFNQWINRARIIIQILLGSIITVQQVFISSSPNPLLIGLAALFLGIPLTRSLDKLIG